MLGSALRREASGLGLPPKPVRFLLTGTEAAVPAAVP